MTERDPGFSSSLKGRTILITRSRSQAADLAAELESRGAVVLYCPTIETIFAHDPAPLDDAISRLEQYDWVVFTSANAVEFFVRRLSEKRYDGLEVLGRRSIAAIGTATAVALSKHEVHTTVMATESTAEGLLDCLVEHLGEGEGFQGVRFLIPRARVARDVLPSGLRNLGASVDAVEAYQTIAPDTDPEEIKRLFRNHSIEAITFTSSSTVVNFAALVGLKDLSALLGKTLAACIGPVTARTAREHGLTRVVQPEAYNIHELAKLIAAELSGPAEGRG